MDGRLRPAAVQSEEGELVEPAAIEKFIVAGSHDRVAA
jgi:hypothetical protein